MGSADSCGVEVGAGGLGAGGLQVRRGSEPSLHPDAPPHGQPPQVRAQHAQYTRAYGGGEGGGSDYSCGVEVGPGGLGTEGLQVRRGSETFLNQDNMLYNQSNQVYSITS